MTPTQQWTTGPQRFPNEEGGGNALSEFVAALDHSGLHAALRYLNGRARFRFTGVYRCQQSVLIIESLYDRENPSLEHCGGIRQLEGTFCSIVLATGEPFSTSNSQADTGLEKFPVRRTVISYSGVPIRMPGGRVAGVLCHYDLRPRLIPREELKTLESVTPYLARYLHASWDLSTLSTERG